MILLKDVLLIAFIIRYMYYPTYHQQIVYCVNEWGVGQWYLGMRTNGMSIGQDHNTGACRVFRRSQFKGYIEPVHNDDTPDHPTRHSGCRRKEKKEKQLLQHTQLCLLTSQLVFIRV